MADMTTVHGEPVGLAAAIELLGPPEYRGADWAKWPSNRMGAFGALEVYFSWSAAEGLQSIMSGCRGKNPCQIIG